MAGLQVLDEMVQLLTSPEFKGKMVVILAGYKQEVEELMDVNPGLRSRFTHTLEFKPMDKDAAVQLLKQMLTAKSLKLSSDAEAQLPAMTKQVRMLSSCSLSWWHHAISSAHTCPVQGIIHMYHSSMCMSTIVD